MDERDPIIRVEGLTTHYGSRRILNNINLEIRPRETMVLLGSSGTGKSTLLRHILALEKPTHGHIYIKGMDVCHCPDEQMNELRRHMGVLFQSGALFGSMSLGDNVALPLRELTRLDESTIQVLIRLKLDLVGLSGFERHYPYQISGGMQQRCGLARALAIEPRVLLMDEPFGAVDPILRDRLQNEFLRLQAQVRKTIVFVTHDVDEAIKMADRIAILQRGGVLAQYDTPSAILAAPASEFVAHFVGADRGLKRLSLARVRDLPLIHPTTARVGEARAELRRRIDEAGADFALLLDEADRPLGWIGRRDLTGDGVVAGGDATPGSPTLQPETTLRDALSAMLGSSVQLGVVVDEAERVLGAISVDAISEVLRAPAGGSS